MASAHRPRRHGVAGPALSCRPCWSRDNPASASGTTPMPWRRRCWATPRTRLSTPSSWQSPQEPPLSSSARLWPTRHSCAWPTSTCPTNSATGTPFTTPSQPLTPCTRRSGARPRPSCCAACSTWPSASTLTASSTCRPSACPTPSPADAPAADQLERLLDLVDVRQQVEESAHAVSGYLAAGCDTDDLLSTLGRMMLREDADFHSFQIVDAAFRQYETRCGTESGRHVLVGLSRFLAAHSPTPRAEGQTYQIALRLQRGEEIYQ